MLKLGKFVPVCSSINTAPTMGRPLTRQANDISPIPLCEWEVGSKHSAFYAIKSHWTRHPQCPLLAGLRPVAESRFRTRCGRSSGEVVRGPERDLRIRLWKPQSGRRRVFGFVELICSCVCRTSRAVSPAHPCPVARPRCEHCSQRDLLTQY